MIKMRKIILSDATEFNAIRAIESSSTALNKKSFSMTFENYTLEKLKTAFMNPKNINIIKIYDNDGELVRVISGYDFYDIQLKYLDGTEQIVVNLSEGDPLDQTVRNLERKLSNISDIPIMEDMEMMTANELKVYKKSILQTECKKNIFKGIHIKTTFGTQHFSFTAEDQRNLESLFNIAQQTGLDIPYHADGELCTVYSSDDIIQIYTALQNHKLYHTTYINMLNRYIEDLSDLDVIKSVTYGKTTLPKEYLDSMNAVLEQGQHVIQQVKNSSKGV